MSLRASICVTLDKAGDFPVPQGPSVGTEDTALVKCWVQQTATLPCRHCYSPKRLNYSLKVSILFIFELMG